MPEGPSRVNLTSATDREEQGGRELEMKMVLYSLWSVVIVAGGVGCGLFLMQGGFGGGHGRFDLVLFGLGLPWSLVPWPETVTKSDLVWLVVIPLVMNLAVVLAFTIAARRYQPVP